MDDVLQSNAAPPVVGLATMASESKSWGEMSADALREAGVLVLVFGLLDKYMFGPGPSAGWTAVVVSVALLSFVLGSVLERTRRT